MITNTSQLDISIRQLQSFRQMLEAMRLRLATTNPSLFPTVAEGYLAKIQELEDDIISFLREHPVESPLTIRVNGPSIRHGIIKASLAAKLISGFQSALYQIGGNPDPADEQGEEPARVRGIRELLGLDLVATAAGSFIIAMDLRWEHRPLFRESDPASIAVEKLISHVNEISMSPEAFSGNRKALRGLKKVSEVIKAGVERIDVSFHDTEFRADASFTPIVRDRIELLLGAPRVGEKTIRGHLIAIDTESNICIVHPTGQSRISCDYEDELEDDLVLALRKEIEMAGQFIPLDWPAGHFRITKIERFRVINDDDGE